MQCTPVYQTEPAPASLFVTKEWEKRVVTGTEHALVHHWSVQAAFGVMSVGTLALVMDLRPSLDQVTTCVGNKRDWDWGAAAFVRG